MNTTSLFTITVLCFAATTLLAAEPEASTETKTTVEPYHLKKRSVCNIAPDVRPPFWPIGWVHHDGPHQDAPVGLKYVLEEKNFAVTSILMGPPAIAFINGRAYEEGQFLKMAKAAVLVATPTAPTAPAMASSAAMPRIRVQRITDGQVWLAFETQIIAVPLKRPELNERKADQELLNEDKDDVAPAVPVAPSVSKN
jgi:hypothetical protein